MQVNLCLIFGKMYFWKYVVMGEVTAQLISPAFIHKQTGAESVDHGSQQLILAEGKVTEAGWYTEGKGEPALIWMLSPCLQQGHVS